MIQSQSYSIDTNSSKEYNNLLYFDRAGERLKELRENRNVTQVELGNKLGYTQQSISMKESGKRQLSSYEIVRFSQALSLTANEVIYFLFGVKVIE